MRVYDILYGVAVAGVAVGGIAVAAATSEAGSNPTYGLLKAVQEDNFHGYSEADLTTATTGVLGSLLVKNNCYVYDADITYTGGGDSIKISSYTVGDEVYTAAQQIPDSALTCITNK